MAKKTNAKKVAPQKATLTVKEPAVAKAADKKTTKGAKKPKVSLQKRLHALFEARPKKFLIGQDHPIKRDLTHFVKWPKYIRLQRQKKILLNRLKVPPPVHLFDHTLDKATVVALFKFLDKMKPEEKKAAKARRLEGAAAIEKAMSGEKTHEEKRKAMKEALKALAEKRVPCVKYGLNHVTNLISKNKAQLVVIAHDVDPIELVVWLPALCRKKKIPFCVVKGKARLGSLVHKKTASVLAVTNVKAELKDEFAKLVEAIKPQFLDNASLLRQWGEPHLGIKRRQADELRRRKLAKTENVKKN